MLDGSTRLVAIVGDPIAQVKSPGGVTAALRAEGRNAVVVPVHVTAAEVDGFLVGAAHALNLDGVIATVPHKFAAYARCATATPRAHFLQAANILRRNADGTWHGDQLDGEGLVAAMRAAGWSPAGRRALVAGAGGAGSAIALALLEGGVAALGVHDIDAGRRDALVARLHGRHGERVRAATADLASFDVIVNASPAGMRSGDPQPLVTDQLSAGTLVADVITEPATTPLLAAARRRGCITIAGADMFASVSSLMVAFLLAEGPLASRGAATAGPRP